jgi:hypothetical protein
MAIFFTPIRSTGGTGGAPSVPKQFSWARGLTAVIFLVVIFVAGVFCAHDDKLSAYSTVLLHSFEILLGALVGMIVGEGAGT